MRGVLFDLEGTLAHYFEKQEATQVLVEGVGLAYEHLKKKRLVGALDEQIWKRVDEEDCEPEDHRVRPLEDRLIRIFRLRKEDLDYDHIIEMTREFCFALFARGRLFEDAADTLKALREKGLKVAIVCNTPWDSPSYLWRGELVRLGLDSLVDDAIFCRDAGWRIPSRRIFEYATQRLALEPQDCLFVGDDPFLDLAGSRGANIPGLLIDRKRAHRLDAREKISDLRQLLDHPLLAEQG